MEYYIGRGIASVAEQLHTSKEKAQEIQDKIFKGFPAILKFEQDSKEMARQLGYVDTLWGRKRRLPDIQLPKYEFNFSKKASMEYDPLDFDQTPKEYWDENLVKKYTKLMDNAYGRLQKEHVKAKAREEGIEIKDNGGFIADAERQCVNARIQGSASDMTKKAMILLGNDKRLKELGFKLLIPIHDELLAQCPIENAKKCSDRFSQLMSSAAKDKLQVPIYCDVTHSYAWYGEELNLEEL